jgi:hypothetical protein
MASLHMQLQQAELAAHEGLAESYKALGLAELWAAEQQLALATVEQEAERLKRQYNRLLCECRPRPQPSKGRCGHRPAAPIQPAMVAA